MQKLSAQDHSQLINLASTLPKGSPEKRAILAGLAKVSQRLDRTTPLKVGDKVNLISSDGNIVDMNRGGSGVGEVQEVEDRGRYWVWFPQHSYSYARKQLHLFP